MFIVGKPKLYVAIIKFVNINSEVLYILDVSSTKYNLQMMFILVDVCVNVLSNVTYFIYIA
jgi:hypothetical protein